MARALAGEGTLDRIRAAGILPVATFKDVGEALMIGNVLRSAGLPLLEVTLRSQVAIDAIDRLTSTMSGLLVGAGTVLEIDQAERALDAGAAFLVAPGLNPELVRHCHERGVLLIPGICTPTELDTARRLGLTLVKFFPAEAMGGTTALSAMAAAFPGMRFLPTGGINGENLVRWLQVPGVVACGGSWLFTGSGESTDPAADIRWRTEEAMLLASRLPRQQ